MSNRTTIHGYCLALTTAIAFGHSASSQNLVTLTKETKMQGSQTVMSMAEGTSFEVSDMDDSRTVKVTMKGDFAIVGDPNGAYVAVKFPIVVPSLTEITFRASPGKAIVIRGK